MNRLIIVGASGHGKVVADIAKLNGYTDIVFLDDKPGISTCSGYAVLGPVLLLNKMVGDVFIAVGNAIVRKNIMEKYSDREFPILIHPQAVVADSVKLGIGTVVMAGAVINPDATIGKGCIINTTSSVDHDCVICDYVHVSVGAHIAGTVTIGKCTWVGGGAIISNNISVCPDCMIGAGAVVIDNITNSGTYIGVPARMIGGET